MADHIHYNPKTETWNEHIYFHNLPDDVKKSFAAHKVKRKLYNKGVHLVRVVSLGHNSFRGTPMRVVSAGGNIVTGAFCMEPLFFDRLKTYAAMMKISLETAIRRKLALLTKFSPNPNLAVKIILEKNFYGFEGPAGAQIDPKSKEDFLGGFIQVFIPNLVDEKSNKVALHHKF